MRKAAGRHGISKRRETAEEAQRAEAHGRRRFSAKDLARSLKRQRECLPCGVRLRASVLFMDLRGFTRLAGRLEPELVVRLLGDFYALMTDVAVAQHAVIDCVIGDAMMLLYGVPVPRKDDGVRAVRTAVDMQRAFLALRNCWLSDGRAGAGQLGLGIAVATGELVLAKVKSPLWIDHMAVGEPVGRAVHLCAAARVADSLIDEATYGAVCSALEGEVVFTSREVAHKQGELIPAYRVQRRRGGLHVVPQRSTTDPVCGVLIDPRKALRRYSSGKTYYFCSQTCAERYLGDRRAFKG